MRREQILRSLRIKEKGLLTFMAASSHRLGLPSERIATRSLVMELAVRHVTMSLRSNWELREVVQVNMQDTTVESD